MARPRRSALLAALLVPALAFAACGGDDDSSKGSSDGSSSGSSSSDEATTTSAAPAAVGKGSGTLSIGGKELAFDAQKCSIDGTGDKAVVAAEGKGAAEGKDFTVVVKRSPSSTSVIETFQLAFSATESIVGTKFTSGASGETAIAVEGKKATGTLEFTGNGGQPSGKGTFTVTCD